jgi:hypothetical protein
MFEMTYGEMFLFLWAVGATGLAWQWRAQARERYRILMGATMFVKRLVVDDKMRDELRALLSDNDDADIKFGMGD